MLLIDLSGSTAKVVELIKAAAIHFVEAARRLIELLWLHLRVVKLLLRR
jgi:hypothetical protein